MQFYSPCLKNGILALQGVQTMIHMTDLQNEGIIQRTRLHGQNIFSPELTMMKHLCFNIDGSFSIIGSSGWGVQVNVSE